MQYHVVQTRTSGDLPGHVSRLAHWNSDTEDRGYWIKNPDTNKYVHVEFLAYEYIKKEDQTRHTGHSWFLLKQDIADVTNLNWYTTLGEQIKNDNFFQLEHWKETDPQFQSGRHMMYPPTAATPQPLEITTTPHIEMEEVAATVTAPAPPAETRTANGNRSLSGVPPPIFNGDRDKSEHFLDKFMSYEIVNGDPRQFTIPYLKVVLCLSYFNGPKVDAWARQHRLWLKQRHEQDGIPMTDKSLWDDFELMFRTAYTDQDMQITAYQKLSELRIVTLLRALRPDVGGWVTLSPRYWTGVPSDGGRAPYSAVLDKDLSWSSKLACCLARQCKRICAKAETSQRRVSK